MTPRYTMLHRLVMVGFASAWIVVTSVAFAADEATIRNPKLDATDDGYQVSADIDFQLTSSMKEAVSKGVPLYFVVEFEISKGRWYWFDQSLAKASRDRRVSYAPLTDQYKISVSGVSQNVATIEDVQRLLSRVRSWTVLQKGRLKPGEKYEAAIRFRLDNAQLPKPFQLDILASKDWNLSSDWVRWTVVGESEPARPAKAAP
jgi:Domain of unknown function (DUF4390)